MNNILFPLVNSVNEPMIGSKCTLRPFTTSGSISDVPIITYSDANGTASFSNVINGIYKFNFSNAGANNPSTYINYEDTVVYLNIPEVTGSISNGFVYITNNVPLPNISGSSSGSGNPIQLGVDISSMCNIIKSQLNDWATQEQGIAVIAEDINEKVLIGFNNCIGPKCLIVFVGEEVYGDESTSDMTGWTKRTFDVVIQRGKILSDPRNSALTNINGPAKSFYSLVEKARDVCRTIIWPAPMCYNPTIYHNIRPGEQSGWLMDSYIISFSILVQIGRIQTEPAELGGGEFVRLNDPLNIIMNQSPG